jgi:hypothetical protein
MSFTSMHNDYLDPDKHLWPEEPPEEYMAETEVSKYFTAIYAGLTEQERAAICENDKCRFMSHSHVADERDAHRLDKELLAAELSEARAELAALKAQSEPIGTWRTGFGLELTNPIGGITDGTKLYATPQPNPDAQDAERYRWLRKHFTRLIVSADPAYSQILDRWITVVQSVQINANFRDCDEASVDTAIDKAMEEK